MLLHDSFFPSTQKAINETHYRTVIVAYSPLFHSTFTLIISIIGLLLNLICCAKIWLIIYQHRIRKLSKIKQSEQSIHVLSNHRYRFLLALTSNDVLLCFSAIVSCLDEKYFFQSFLARHHLCAAQVLIWKFTLHFIPLLIIVILCRYHYILKNNFQVNLSKLSTLTQLLCTDLSILIPFVLALAWSVDGLWLWGVAHIKDFINHSISPENTQNDYLNETVSSVMKDSNSSVIKLEEQNEKNIYLPEQAIICYLQTNHNINFTVRLVRLIQADFLLLFSLHLIGLCLEIALHIRLYCCTLMKKVVSSSGHERRLCIYILYIFLIMTFTSLPFYLHRSIEILVDIQLTFFNSRVFAQILLCGSCFKLLFFFPLFFPSSILFKLKYYFKCYSPVDIQIVEQNKTVLALRKNSNQQQQAVNRSKQHRYSLFVHSTHHSKVQTKLRTLSSPIIRTTTDQRRSSLTKSEDLKNWLRLTTAFVNKDSKEMPEIEVI